MKLRVLRTMCSCWIVAAITIFGLSGCGAENNDNEMQTSISKDNSETDEKSIESKGEKEKC